MRPTQPPDLPPVQLLPGWTLGAIYLARYTAGSSLRYNELMVLPALVRHGLRLGGWVSHIYVDEPRAMAGGREIWALPKEMAEFSHEADGSTVVRQAGRVLCSFEQAHEQPRPARWMPLPLFAPVISKRGGRVLWFNARGTARLASGRGKVQVPAGSPFARLGFGDGRRLQLDRLDLLVQPPPPGSGL